MIRNFCCKAFLLIWCFISYGNPVPIDYCLHPLNQSDCGMKATPVFSYYKPGSRCEIEMWRGCPTFNKFPDEVLCSHHCIYKLGRADDNQLDFIDEMETAQFDDECNVPINDGDCGAKEQFKYTFIDNLCLRVPWKGCQSPNMFDDVETCVDTCNPQTTYNIKNQLDTLPMDDVEVINNILDNVVAESTPRSAPIIQLKLLIKATEGYTETTTEKTTSTIASTTSTLIPTTTQTVKTSTIEESTKVEETTSKIEETTSKIEETTSESEETTSESEETTATVTEATTRAATITTVITTSTTEGDGSADEVIIT